MLLFTLYGNKGPLKNIPESIAYKTKPLEIMHLFALKYAFNNQQSVEPAFGVPKGVVALLLSC